MELVEIDDGAYGDGIILVSKHLQEDPDEELKGDPKEGSYLHLIDEDDARFTPS